MENIYKIWDRFEVSSAVEMHLETAEFSLHLKKQGAGDSNLSADAGNGKVYEATSLNPKKTYETVSSQSENTNAKSTGKGVDVKSPLAGIFYRASSPEAQPFVKLGDTVKKGDVIAIIEAMKMMNEVVAPEDGIVESIFVKDSEMVEYDQSLFRLSEA